MEIKRRYRADGIEKYEARWYVAGRLKCRFFSTEAERERFIDEFQEALPGNGTGLRSATVSLSTYSVPLMSWTTNKVSCMGFASRLIPEE